MMTADTILTVASGVVVAVASAGFTAAGLLARVQTEIAGIRQELARNSRQLDRLEELYRDHDREIARASAAASHHRIIGPHSRPAAA